MIIGKKIWIVFKQMIKQISRDLMLLIVCITPFLAGTFFKVGVPIAEKMLCEYFGYPQIMTPYYYIFDWLMAILPGMMFAFVGALVALGEIDDRIAGFMAVTPVGLGGYLVSRLVFPAIASSVVGIFVVCVFGLSQMSMISIIILCVSSGIMGISVALLILAISTNKVEGMAIGKIAGLIIMGIFVPIVFHTPMQYIAGVLPAFWIGKYLLEGNVIYAILFLVTSVIWISILYRHCRRKVLL